MNGRSRAKYIRFGPILTTGQWGTIQYPGMVEGS